MLDQRLLGRILEEALQKGGDWAEIYVEKKQSSSLLCEENRIEKINSGSEQGAGIRVVKGESTAFVSTNKLEEKDLLAAASLAARVIKGRVRSVASLSLPLNLQVDKADYAKREVIDLDQKAELVLAANRAAREAGSEIRQVTVGLADLHKQVQIANSFGEMVEDEVSRVRLAVNAIAARQDIIQTGFASSGGTRGWDILLEVSFEEQARRAAQLALRMLNANPAPAGQMPVVMAAEAGGTMVHEACGHGLEADLVQKGLSVYKKTGDKVAAPLVTVIDDPTLPGKYGSYRYDDEGSRGRPSYLIKGGVLNDYLYDRVSADRAGRRESGNGRRESYQNQPIPRMSNTMIMPGSDDPEEIIKSTPWGLLVKKMGGGQVNTTNGDFVFEVQEGYLIKDGEVGPAVRGATLSGNGPEVLKNIDRVGSDLGFGIGVCGKDGQGVPVADAQPTIRIKRLTVGGTGSSGTAGGYKRL